MEGLRQAVFLFWCDANVCFWQILLQNTLAFLPNDDSVALMRFAVEAIDDGAAQSRPRRVFYSFRLGEAVPDDHPARAIAAVLDLSWVHSELAPFYPTIGRPSIDPVLMIRAGRGLRVCDPLGAGVMPRGASEPCLSLVLWALD
jgi:hypothetical protein